MKSYPNNIIGDINEQVDLCGYLESKGLEIKKPKSFKCILKGHKDKNPSASIENNRYKCFGASCPSGNNRMSVVDFFVYFKTGECQFRPVTADEVSEIKREFSIADGGKIENKSSDKNKKDDIIDSFTIGDFVSKLKRKKIWGNASGGKMPVGSYNQGKEDTWYTHKKAKEVHDKKQEHMPVLAMMGARKSNVLILDIDTEHDDDSIIKNIVSYIEKQLGIKPAVFYSKSRKGGHLPFIVEGEPFKDSSGKVFIKEPLTKEQIDAGEKPRMIEVFLGTTAHHITFQPDEIQVDGKIPKIDSVGFEKLMQGMQTHLGYEGIEVEQDDDSDDADTPKEKDTKIEDLWERIQKRQHRTLASIRERFKTKGIETQFKYCTRYAKSSAMGQRIDNTDNTRTLTINEGLTIFASYTGGGKSTMLSTIAYDISQSKKGKILYISLEEIERNLLPRLLLYDKDVRRVVEQSAYFQSTNQNYLNALKRIIQDDDLDTSNEKIFDKAFTKIHSRFLFCYEPEITADVLYNLIQRIQQEDEWKAIDAIILDYLQIFGGGSGGTEQLRIKSVMSAIRSICKNTGIPFIAGAQTSNGRKSAGNEKTSTPIAVGDTNKIRESDDIGQSASLIVALNTADNNFVLLKNREGELGRAGITLVGNMGKFVQSKEDLNREITMEGKGKGLEIPIEKGGVISEGEVVIGEF